MESHDLFSMLIDTFNHGGPGPFWDLGEGGGANARRGRGRAPMPGRCRRQVPGGDAEAGGELGATVGKWGVVGHGGAWGPRPFWALIGPAMIVGID